MIEVIAFVGGAVLFVVGLLYFVIASSWRGLKDDTAPVLTFKAFRDLYALNPKSWDLNLEYVTHHYETDKHYYSQRVEFAKYPDVIRYRFFYGKIERDRKELKRIKNEKEFIKYVQCDIDDYRRRNIEEMEKHLQK